MSWEADPRLPWLLKNQRLHSFEKSKEHECCELRRLLFAVSEDIKSSRDLPLLIFVGNLAPFINWLFALIFVGFSTGKDDRRFCWCTLWLEVTAPWRKTKAAAAAISQFAYMPIQPGAEPLRPLMYSAYKVRKAMRHNHHQPCYNHRKYAHSIK